MEQAGTNICMLSKLNMRGHPEEGSYAVKSCA